LPAVELAEAWGPSRRGRGRRPLVEQDALFESSDLISPQHRAWLDTHLSAGKVEAAYSRWPQPAAIISDGAYGVGGFPGDPRTAEGLADWYRPHAKAWAAASAPGTTLWFWNTELGWANAHPVLEAAGFEYVQSIVWDKGVAHIAGNVNSETIRRFPVVTEVCVFYRRRLEVPTSEGPPMLARQWLRNEWLRAGLALNAANAACGVKNAATRKYLTQDWLWYLPPPEAMAQLVAYANEHGRPEGAPYFSVDGHRSMTAREWGKFRDTWTHQHGVTNVWEHPPLNGPERARGKGERSAPRVYNPTKGAALHLNQKPLEFMRRIILACTAPGDVVWEPFGGLCSASVAAAELGREPYAAELVKEFRATAYDRLADALVEAGTDVFAADTQAHRAA
jgi:site-specific DNA-methyltransferase (adenine-specific)